MSGPEDSPADDRIALDECIEEIERLTQELATAENYIGRALRLIKAVKKSYCYHACRVVPLFEGDSTGGTHEILCQETQEAEEFLESRKQ